MVDGMCPKTLKAGRKYEHIDEIATLKGCISYSNKELDKIIDQLSTAFDLKERQKLTIEAEKILLDDCATIYLVGENNFVVANQKVQNIVPYPIDYYFIDNGMSVAE